MNGRIYDPQLGRFLSADLVIDGPINLQGYNRYSYVKNNPLSFNDPTGYYRLGLLEFTDGGGVGGFFKDLGGYLSSSANGLAQGGVDIAMSFRRGAEGIGTFAGYLSLDPVGTLSAGYDQITTNLAEGYMLASDTGISDFQRDLSSAASMYFRNTGGFRDDVNDIFTGAALDLATAGFSKGGSALGKLDNVSIASKIDDTVDAAIGSNGLFESTLRQVDSLDFTVPRNKTTFYSGPGNKEKALAFAQENGAMTIDSTPGGKYLNSLDLYGQFGDKADDIWKAASTKFATQAKGKINLFTNGSAPDRVFQLVEKPILDKNIDLTTWTFHY